MGRIEEARMLTNRLFDGRGLDKRTCVLWVPVLCFGAYSMLWGQAQRQTREPPTDPLQEARALLNGHDLEGARRVLERTVERRPRSAEAWLLLADTCSQLNLESEAIQGYEKVLRLDPESPSALYNLAILHLRGNRPKEAIRYLEILRRRNPRDPEVLFSLAQCLFLLGRAEEGQRTVTDILNTSSDSSSLYLKLGKFLMARGRAEDAIGPLGRALQLAPDSDESRITLAVAESQSGHPARVIEVLQGHEELNSPLYASLLGSAYCDAKDFERAVPYLEAAVRQQVDERQLYLELAKSYAGMAKAHEAVETLHQAHARWPADAQIRSALARELFRAGDRVGALVVLREAPETALTQEELTLLVESYAGLGRRDEAQRYGQLAVQRADVSESAILALANVYQLDARDPEAITLLEKHRARFSESPPYLFTLAFSYYNRGNYTASDDLLNSVIARDPTLAQAFYLRGNCLSSLGKPEQAVPEYETAARLAPGKFLYHFQLGMVLSRLGQKERAEAELKKSLALNDQHAPAHYELARIYGDTNRDELARRQLEEAIKVNPQFESSYYLLSQVYARLGRGEDSSAALKQFKELQRQERESERARKEASLGRQNP